MVYAQARTKMSMALNLLASMLFMLGCVLIAANWAVLAKNVENRRKGIERHSSSITLVPQVGMLLSGLFFHASRQPWLEWWIPLCAGVPDPGIWRLVLLTFSMLRERPRRNPD
jgi:4-amino-4-deoxy-L-arabinose transferase-like glycosyltransferase